MYIDAIHKGNSTISAVYKGNVLVFKACLSTNWLINNLFNTIVPGSVNSHTLLNYNRFKFSSISANSLILNQIVDDNFGSSTTYWAKNRLTQTNSNNVGHFVTNSSAYAFATFYHSFSAGQLLKNHYYLYSIYARITSGNCSAIRIDHHGVSVTSISNPTLNTWYRLNGIVQQTRNNTESTNAFDCVRQYSNTSDIVVDSDTMECMQPMLFDLTLMFGIGNEPTSVSDARVQSLLSQGYIPYNAGTYKSTSLTRLISNSYNLLNLNRTLGTLSEFDNTTPRTFEEGKYYFGLSVNNYYAPNNIQGFEKNATGITFRTSAGAYGVTFPVKVKGNTSYRVNYDCTVTSSHRVGWYDVNGNFISYSSGAGDFISPTDAYWATICLTSETANTNVTFSNITFNEADGVISTSNQLVEHGNFDDGTNGWYANNSTLSVANNTATFTATTQYGDIRTNVYSKVVVGHSYLITAEVKSETASGSNAIAVNFGYSSPQTVGYIPNNTDWNVISKVLTANNQGSGYLVFIRDNRASDRASISVRNVMLIDLTLEFPGNEPTSTSDPRVESLLYKGYIPYHTEYYLYMAPVTLPVNYQGNASLKARDTLEITDSAYIFTKNTSSVTLTGNETIDNLTQYGETFMGISNVFPVSFKPPYNDVPLNNKYPFSQGYIDTLTEGKCYTYGRNFYYNIGTNDAQVNKDFITGLILIYTLDTPIVTTIPRKHLGIVDLGTLNWYVQGSGSHDRANTLNLKGLIKPATAGNVRANIMCAKYMPVTADQSYLHVNDNVIAVDTSGGVHVYDSSLIGKTAEETKASMSGVYLFYETNDEVPDLATYITVQPGGTITSDSEVPPNIQGSVKVTD